MKVQSFWNGLKNCYTFYIVLNNFRNHHIEFTFDRTILTCLNYLYAVRHERTEGPFLILKSFAGLKINVNLKKS